MLEPQYLKATNPLIARLCRKSVFDPVSGCWEWQGSRLPPRGEGPRYGYLALPTGKSGGRKVYVHRLSWELHKGPIPTGAQVAHKCDNPPCWNPEHLFLATNAENRADMVSKERHPRGIRHGLHRLTEEQVLAIRADRRDGMKLKELVTKHGVPFKTVEKVCTYATWKHLP